MCSKSLVWIMVLVWIKILFGFWFGAQMQQVKLLPLVRLLGDMTHLLCIVVLLPKIRTMKSCAGTYFVFAQLPLLSLFLFAFTSQCGLTLLFLCGAYLVPINAIVNNTGWLFAKFNTFCFATWVEDYFPSYNLECPFLIF